MGLQDSAQEEGYNERSCRCYVLRDGREVLHEKTRDPRLPSVAEEGEPYLKGSISNLTLVVHTNDQTL